MRPRTGLLVFAMLAVVTPISATALAASGALAKVFDTSFGPPVCLQDLSSFTPGSGVEARCIGNVPGGTFDIFATASATFGKLGVLTHVDINHVRFPATGGFDDDSFASFSDTLTVSAGSQAVFTFGIRGAPVLDIHGIPIPARVHFGKIGDIAQVVYAPGAQVSLTYSGVTPGKPFNIGFALHELAEDPIGSSSCTPDGFCDWHLIGDFSDTASLKSVQVLDDNGNPISGVTITSESGFDYSNLSSGLVPSFETNGEAVGDR
jgi:hypothetical protein